MATSFITHVQTGTHAARPGAGTVPQGTLYACSTHGLVYQSDGASTWSEWFDPADSTSSFGSNVNAVGEANAPGSSNSNTRADHVHLGVRTLSHASNTFAGPVTITNSGIVGITSPTPGTFNISAAATGSAGGGLNDQGAFTFLDATEAAAPGTPGSGKVRIYAKSDGRIYSKDDTGAEFGPFSAGGGGDSGYVAAITAESNITHYWPINETTGTTFADAIGSDDLSVTLGSVGLGNPSLTRDWTAGRSAVYSQASRITRAALTWPAAWSIEAWMVIGTSASDVWLLGQWNGAGAMVYLASAGNVRIYSGGTNATWAAGSAAAVEGLHHIVMTHDGTTQRLYWDAVNVVSQTVASPTTTDGGTFGVPMGGGGGLGLAVGDIAYYNVALSGATISAHYALGT